MRYGKRVLGEDAWNKQQAAQKVKRMAGPGLGKRVTGAKAAPAPVVDPDLELETNEEEETAEGGQGDTGSETGSEGGEGAGGGKEGDETPVTLSISEIKDALTENPALFDTLLAAEFERPEGLPRKGALRLFLEVEKKRDEGPRPHVVAELNTALAVK